MESNSSMEASPTKSINKEEKPLEENIVDLGEQKTEQEKIYEPLVQLRNLFDRIDVLGTVHPIDCYVMPRTDSHQVLIYSFGVMSYAIVEL